MGRCNCEYVSIYMREQLANKNGSVTRQVEKSLVIPLQTKDKISCVSSKIVEG